MPANQVLIIGSGDRASACALRLYRGGLNPAIISNQRPFDLHHQRTCSKAAYMGHFTLDTISVRTLSWSLEKGLIKSNASIIDFVRFATRNREIPLIFAEEMVRWPEGEISYAVVTDADLFRQVSAYMGDQLKTIAPADVYPQANYLVSMAEDTCGQVLYPFNKNELTAQETKEKTSRQLYQVEAPLEGVFTAMVEMGAHVREREELARINDIPILSPAAGMVSGILNSGLIVAPHTVFAEISQMRNLANPRYLPVEAFCFAGGVLEAILYDLNLQSE